MVNPLYLETRMLLKTSKKWFDPELYNKYDLLIEKFKKLPGKLTMMIEAIQAVVDAGVMNKPQAIIVETAKESIKQVDANLKDTVKKATSFKFLAPVITGVVILAIVFIAIKSL